MIEFDEHFIHEGASNVRDNYITARREIYHGDKVMMQYSVELVEQLRRRNPDIQPPFGFFPPAEGK